MFLVATDTSQMNKKGTVGCRSETKTVNISAGMETMVKYLDLVLQGFACTSYCTVQLVLTHGTRSEQPYT